MVRVKSVREARLAYLDIVLGCIERLEGTEERIQENKFFSNKLLLSVI
jgi:hypothetical protein